MAVAVSPLSIRDTPSHVGAVSDHINALFSPRMILLSRHARSLQADRGGKLKWGSRQTTKTGTGIGCRLTTDKCHVFYNHVAQAGSEEFGNIIDKLSDKNAFRVVNSGQLDQKTISTNEQRVLGSFLTRQPCGTIFNRPIHYVNFKALDVKPPIWINMIRNPIDRLVSRFYHLYPGFDKAEVPRLFDKCVRKAMAEAPTSLASRACLMPTIQLAYFCGQHPDCFVDPLMTYDEPTRVNLLTKMRQRAEYNVLNRYLAVGLFEKLEKFMRLLQAMLPEYFKGASALWKAQKEPVLKRYPHPTNETMTRLEDYYQQEMLFYRFVEDLFYIKGNACGVLEMSKARKNLTSAITI
eukprot:CAMPEP_0198222516 /NCGR_PEP_ID=MMETSP1445-20131203/88476_1 /TAXON_ID=36898 /ORGANISM="Pyramimonas sp., Strain CCMP2087" /LENGTH=350 /DNA_ID=CAMNT_0043901043 /DNA_START=140 /DNA_END=1192 /DNA_ORIENTATION=-